MSDALASCACVGGWCIGITIALVMLAAASVTGPWTLTIVTISLSCVAGFFSKTRPSSRHGGRRRTVQPLRVTSLLLCMLLTAAVLAHNAYKYGQTTPHAQVTTTPSFTVRSPLLPPPRRPPTQTTASNLESSLLASIFLQGKYSNRAHAVGQAVVAHTAEYDTKAARPRGSLGQVAAARGREPTKAKRKPEFVQVKGRYVRKKFTKHGRGAADRSALGLDREAGLNRDLWDTQDPMAALWLEHWSKLTRRYPMPKDLPPGWRAWYMPPQPANSSGASGGSGGGGGDVSEAWKQRGADIHFYISFNTGHCGSTALGNTMSYYDSSFSVPEATGASAETGDGGGGDDDNDDDTQSEGDEVALRGGEVAVRGDDELVGSRDIEHRDSPCLATFELFGGALLAFGERFPLPAHGLEFAERFLLPTLTELALAAEKTCYFDMGHQYGLHPSIFSALATLLGARLHIIHLERDRQEVAASYAASTEGPCSTKCKLCICPSQKRSRRLCMNPATHRSFNSDERQIVGPEKLGSRRVKLPNFGKSLNKGAYRSSELRWMVSEFGCRWDKLKEFLRNDSGGEGVRVGSGGGGGTEPALAQLAADYEYGERFDGRNETTRDPVGVWVAPRGVEVLTLRWAKRYGPGLQPLFSHVASFVGFPQPEWLVASQKEHKEGRRRSKRTKGDRFVLGHGKFRPG